VIGRLVLALLATVMVLAAGWMTALFIYCHPVPAESGQVTARHPARVLPEQAAHSEVTTKWWCCAGFLSGNGAGKGEVMNPNWAMMVTA